jgi:DNA polymerase V
MTYVQHKRCFWRFKRLLRSIPADTKINSTKQIVCAKSFGRAITGYIELEEAVSTYTARVAEKLREQDSLCGRITVFVRTNAFDPTSEQYTNEFTIDLPYPTAFTPDLIRHALKGLHAIYREGYQYKKF